MSLGFHKAQWLGQAFIRRKKTILQEERPGNEIYIAPITNPFGETGVLSFNRTTDDSGFEAASNPSLKVDPSQEFRFTSNDDFTIESWVYFSDNTGEPFGDSAFDGRRETYFNIWMTDFGEEDFDSLFTFPYLDHPELIHNGFSFQLKAIPNGQTQLTWVSAPPEENIGIYDSVGDITDSAGVGKNYMVFGMEPGAPYGTSYDSGGSPERIAEFEGWNHIACSHKAGEGIRLYLNGRMIAGPYLVNIKPTQTQQYLHFGGLGLALLSPPSLTSNYNMGYSVMLVGSDRVFGYYPDDVYGFSTPDIYISQTRISNTARYTTGGFIPQKHGNDDNTLLLLDFAFEDSADEDIVDNDTATRTFQQPGRPQTRHFNYFRNLDSAGFDSVGTWNQFRLTDTPAPKFGTTCFGGYEYNLINSKVLSWIDPDMSPYTNPALTNTVFDGSGWIESKLNEEVFTFEQWVYFDTPDHDINTFRNGSNILLHMPFFKNIALHHGVLGAAAAPDPMLFIFNYARTFAQDSIGDIGAVIGYSWQPNIQQWYHLAITKGPDAEIRVYIDGVEQFVSYVDNTDENDNIVDSGGTWRDLSHPWWYRGSEIINSRDIALFGQSGNGAVDAFAEVPKNVFHDELRLSKVLRYDGDFTPPTAPFTNDSDTVLLWHFEGTPGDDDFEDDNS
jgi:hypothetical protein